VLVGCPVSRRGWVLARWFDHVETAAARVPTTVSYLFVADPGDDDTMTAIEEAGLPVTVVELAEGRADDVRLWTPERVQHLVDVRNALLAKVRQLAPETFLSLDSDILLHPDAIANLLESFPRFDAIGGRTYMTPKGTSCPSWGVPVRAGGVRRCDQRGVFPIDVIMAIKLMGSAAYQVDYEYHRFGEDLGWSAACRRRGLRLGVDARVPNKHCMEPAMLARVDPRCGY
jgi:hypothetical protein